MDSGYGSGYYRGGGSGYSSYYGEHSNTSLGSRSGHQSLLDQPLRRDRAPLLEPRRRNRGMSWDSRSSDSRGSAHSPQPPRSQPQPSKSAVSNRGRPGARPVYSPARSPSNSPTSRRSPVRAQQDTELFDAYSLQFPNRAPSPPQSSSRRPDHASRHENFDPAEVNLLNKLMNKYGYDSSNPYGQTSLQSSSHRSGELSQAGPIPQSETFWNNIRQSVSSLNRSDSSDGGGGYDRLGSTAHQLSEPPGHQPLVSSVPPMTLHPGSYAPVSIQSSEPTEPGEETPFGVEDIWGPQESQVTPKEPKESVSTIDKLLALSRAARALAETTSMPSTEIVPSQPTKPLPPPVVASDPPAYVTNVLIHPKAAWPPVFESAEREDENDDEEDVTVSIEEAARLCEAPEWKFRDQDRDSGFSTSRERKASSPNKQNDRLTERRNQSQKLRKKSRSRSRERSRSRDYRRRHPSRSPSRDRRSSSRDFHIRKKTRSPSPGRNRSNRKRRFRSRSRSGSKDPQKRISASSTQVASQRSGRTEDLKGKKWNSSFREAGGDNTREASQICQEPSKPKQPTNSISPKLQESMECRPMSISPEPPTICGALVFERPAIQDDLQGRVKEFSTPKSVNNQGAQRKSLLGSYVSTQCNPQFVQNNSMYLATESFAKESEFDNVSAFHGKHLDHGIQHFGSHYPNSSILSHSFSNQFSNEQQSTSDPVCTKTKIEKRKKGKKNTDAWLKPEKAGEEEDMIPNLDKALKITHRPGKKPLILVLASWNRPDLLPENYQQMTQIDRRKVRAKRKRTCQKERRQILESLKDCDAEVKVETFETSLEEEDAKILEEVRNLTPDQFREKLKQKNRQARRKFMQFLKRSGIPLDDIFQEKKPKKITCPEKSTSEKANEIGVERFEARMLRRIEKEKPMQSSFQYAFLKRAEELTALLHHDMKMSFSSTLIPAETTLSEPPRVPVPVPSSAMLTELITLWKAKNPQTDDSSSPVESVEPDKNVAEDFAGKSTSDKPSDGSVLDFLVSERFRVSRVRQSRMILLKAQKSSKRKAYLESIKNSIRADERLNRRIRKKRLKANPATAESNTAKPQTISSSTNITDGVHRTDGAKNPETTDTEGEKRMTRNQKRRERKRKSTEAYNNRTKAAATTAYLVCSTDATTTIVEQTTTTVTSTPALRSLDSVPVTQNQLVAPPVLSAPKYSYSEAQIPIPATLPPLATPPPPRQMRLGTQFRPPFPEPCIDGFRPIPPHIEPSSYYFPPPSFRPPLPPTYPYPNFPPFQPQYPPRYF